MDKTQTCEGGGAEEEEEGCLSSFSLLGFSISLLAITTLTSL